MNFKEWIISEGKSRSKWLCLDCGVDTGKIGEHYFLKNDVWFKVHDSNQGMLCIGCLEKRLGRKLNKNDFTDAYINRPGSSGMSQRLIDRLKS